MVTPQATVRMVAAGGQGVVNVITGDDTIWTWGADSDIVMVLRSTVLAVNTALTSVIEGVPITPAIAANSLILSNITDTGDILVAVSPAGNSEAILWADSSARVLYFPWATSWLVMMSTGASPPAPDTLLHLWSGTAGVVAATAGSLLTLEAAGGAYLQFLTPAANESGLQMGDPGAAGAGAFVYRHSTNTWSWVVDGATRVLLTGTVMEFQQASIIRTIANNNLTINADGTGTIILQANGATIVTINDTIPMVLINAVAGPTLRLERNAVAGTLDFDADGTNVYISSAGADLPILLRTNSVERVRLTASTLAFNQATTITALAATSLTLNALTTGFVAIQSGGVEFIRANNTGLGFYAVAPVARAAAIAAPAGGATVDAEARTAINSIRDAIRLIGITS